MAELPKLQELTGSLKKAIRGGAERVEKDKVTERSRTERS
jgi:hypothetical protein